MPQGPWLTFSLLTCKYRVLVCVAASVASSFSCLYFRNLWLAFFQLQVSNYIAIDKVHAWTCCISTAACEKQI